MSPQADRSPAFQFYARDFLSDVRVMAMSLEEVGAYWKLISICWLEEGLPSELPVLARLLHVTPAKMAKIWPAIEPCFRLESGVYQHPRLDREREKQDEYRRKQSEKGRKSAEARFNHGSATVQPESNREATGTQPKGNSSSSSASSTAVKKNIARDKPAPDPRVRTLGKFFDALHVERFGTSAAFTKGKDGMLLRELLASRDEPELQALMRAFFASTDPFVIGAGFTVGVFKSQVGKLLAKVAAPKPALEPTPISPRQMYYDEHGAGGPAGWRDECASLHGGRCSEAFYHFQKVRADGEKAKAS